MRRYHLTPTAAENLRSIAFDTRKRWGSDQAVRYISELRAAFVRLTRQHEKLPRKQVATVVDVRLHRSGSHYIAFTALTSDEIIILAVLHERMDVEARLRRLQTRSREEIDGLKTTISRDPGIG